MLKRFFVFIVIFGLISSSSIASELKNNGLEVSSAYFSFTMPPETKGTYVVENKNGGISVLEKLSVKEGSGGWVFTIKMCKDPKDYADNYDAKKIGELTDKTGKTYDMVLICPTEIYYGEGETIQNNYIRLAGAVEHLEVKGINGSKYVKNKGMKGETLYGEVLRQYKTEMKSKRSLKKLGYAYYDINSDGIEELFIGEKNLIYSVYTMVNRKPANVIAAKEDEILFLCNDENLWVERLYDSGKNIVNISVLERNSVKLTPVITFIYDKNLNKKKPWFVSYGTNGSLENISKKEYSERTELFREPLKFNYTSLSLIK